MNAIISKVTDNLGYAHYCGDVQFSSKSALRILFEKYRFLQDMPKRYIGCFHHQATEFDRGDGVMELFDPEDVYIDIDVDVDEDDELIPGDLYTVRVTKWEKDVKFVRYVNEPFHKWLTEKGFYMIFLQSDVDTLTENQKKELHII
jgi:hypothetical protein